MGIQLNSQKNKNIEYVRAIEDYLDLFIVKYFSIFRRFDSYYRLTKDYKREQEALCIIHDMTRSVIRNRENERKNTNNIKVGDVNNEFGIKRKIAFMDLLLDLKDRGNFTERDIRDEANTFLVAVGQLSARLYFL